MCQSMVNIQSPTAEIRRGKKERRRQKKKETTGQKYNGQACPITEGGHTNRPHCCIAGFWSCGYVVKISICKYQWWSLQTRDLSRDMVFTWTHVHVRYMLSPVRLSTVCLSVVCNARAPYSGGWNFRQYFYGIWYLGHPLTSRENFTDIVPGEPLCRRS